MYWDTIPRQWCGQSEHTAIHVHHELGKFEFNLRPLHFSWFTTKLLFQLYVLFICNCQKQYRKKIRISVLKGCPNVLHLLQVLCCWLTWQEITFYRCRYVQCHNNTSFTFLHVLFCSWSWRMPLCHVRMTFSLSVLMVY